MIGDQTDIAGRLRSVLPARWFGDATPVLDNLLNALATGWAYMFELLGYTQRQTRITSASDVWLDLVALDFFGPGLPRARGQSDQTFRPVVLRNILRSLGTRAALISAISDLTGRAPQVFEPRNTTDTGGYGSLAVTGSILGGGCGYCLKGGWGSLSLPYQCFVTAFRPHINGVANLSGWRMPMAGYGQGALEYVGADTAQGQIPDSEILAEIVRAVPVGVVVWTNISS